ncbi:MAG: 4-hydroxythreonine-4-phosphate dehydrogenase PdxA [Alphaproteobacteria bacterium]|nr:MAG: 4-hydroxythreonine-4-phosphate dehydrogenase PdxA [Alphaproteobacteria bacterium]
MNPVAVTGGEPAGIGLELAPALRAATGGRIPFFVLADPRHCAAAFGDTAVVEIDAPEDTAAAMARGVPVLPVPFDGERIPGRPDPRNARGVIAAIERAVSLVMDGAASAITTLPIAKKALKDGAGFPFPGHTEFLAHLAGVSRVVMMLACPELRVVPATIHIPLAEVPQTLDAALLEGTLRVTDDALRRDFGIAEPTIAVAGLNPHAGEGGAMGREEIELIAPVLDALRADGLRLLGPLAADTMFHARARAGYDAAVAMYHDQALIPIKTIDFSGGVNVTLGLPFVRTSPDHGTAFDIAGTGTADPSSTIAALKMAWQMARARHGRN